MMPGTGPSSSRESRRVVAGTVCAVFMALVQAGPPAVCQVAPQTHRTRLDNGLVVLVRPNPAAQTIGMTVHIGLPATLENARTAGIRSLLARMLLERPPDAAGDMPTARLAELGAVVETDVRRDSLVVRCVGLADGFAGYLPCLREIVFGTQFAWEQMPAARTAQLHALTARADTADTWAQQLADAYSFRGTSYSWPVEGSTASLQAIGQRQLRELHELFVRPNNCVIAVCGPLGVDECVRAISAAFGSALPGPGLRRDRSSLPDREAVYIHRPWPGEGATVLLSVRGPGARDEGFAVVETLWALLAGGEGSRLWRSLRAESGLVYGIGSAVDRSTDFSVFSLRARCDTERVGTVYSLIGAQLRSVQQTPPTAAETRRAISYLAGARLMSEQYNLGAAELLGVHELFAPGDGPGLLSRMMQDAGRVTPEDLRVAASQYLRRGVWVQLGGIPPSLQGAAPEFSERLGMTGAG